MPSYPSTKFKGKRACYSKLLQRTYILGASFRIHCVQYRKRILGFQLQIHPKDLDNLALLRKKTTYSMESNMD